jgi:hypothetical protein
VILRLALRKHWVFRGVIASAYSHLTWLEVERIIPKNFVASALRFEDDTRAAVPSLTKLVLLKEKAP